MQGGCRYYFFGPLLACTHESQGAMKPFRLGHNRLTGMRACEILVMMKLKFKINQIVGVLHMNKSMLFVVVFSGAFLSCLVNGADGAGCHDEGGYFEKFAEEKERKCGHILEIIRSCPSGSQMEKNISEDYRKCYEETERKFHENYGTKLENMLILFATEQCQESSKGKNLGPCIVGWWNKLYPHLNDAPVEFSPIESHVEDMKLCEAFYQFRDKEFRQKFKAKN